MFTYPQLLAHLVGDYLLQSDWMANQKTKSVWPALLHVLTYTLPFLLLTTSWKALLFIAATHFVIDHWRLARYVCWAKNWLAPKHLRVCDCGKTVGEGTERTACGCSYINDRFVINLPWEACKGTGYGPDKPIWMSVWLLIITDNTLHLLCNGLALHWFG